MARRLAAEELRAQLIACDKQRATLLNQLVELHTAKALALARHYAQGDAGLREDLEDHLIGSLIEAANAYDPTVSAFWTYAQTVLAGSVKMYFRSKRREVPAGLVESCAAESDVSAEAAQHTADCEAIVWARRMLKEVGLTSDVAVAALLRHITVVEAAQRLDMRYETLRRKLVRARRSETARRFGEAVGVRC